MDSRRFLGGAIMLCCVMLLASPVFSGDEPTEEEKAAWLEMTSPGPHHKQIAKSAGTWETKTTFWEPGKDPTESIGKSEIVVLMDGRFASEVDRSTIWDMPWEGRGIYGYDKVKEKHVGVWFDTFGTGILYFEGECENDCGVVTTYGEHMDPMTKSMKRMKAINTIMDDDHAVLEIYDVTEEGKEFKMMESHYTREKT